MPEYVAKDAPLGQLEVAEDEDEELSAEYEDTTDILNKHLLHLTSQNEFKPRGLHLTPAERASVIRRLARRAHIAQDDSHMPTAEADDASVIQSQVAIASNLAAATTDESGLHVREMTQEDQNNFWEVQEKIGTMENTAPSYAEACNLLQLGPKDPKICAGLNSTDLHSKPWQVTGVAWLLQQERGRPP